MKLPLHARPIMRSVSSVRRSDALSSVTASACDIGTCGPSLFPCALSGIMGGPAAVAICVAGLAVSNPGCRDCIGEAMQQYANLTAPRGDEDRPLLTTLPGL